MSTTEEPTTKPKRSRAAAVDARPETPESPGVESAAATPLPRIQSVRQIADAQDLPEKEIDVPEWGGSILMRGLPLGTVEGLQEQRPNGGFEYLLALVAATIVEPDMTTEQASVLREKSNDVMERLIKEALVLNGLGAALERALVEQFPGGRPEAAAVLPGAGAEDAGGRAA